MSDCCNIESQTHHKRSVLITVLVINSLMFGLQFSAGWFAHSTALLADAMDMLGDALAYAFSLYALARGARWLAKASLFKGVLISLFGIIILIEAIYKSHYGSMPQPHLMTVFAFVGLCANAICVYLLVKFKNADINMRSTFICARNDIIGNFSVLLAAMLVAIFHSPWPDLIIGVLLALWLLNSAAGVLKQSYQALQT